MVLPPSMQGSLPAGWLAFTGRELNPLDRDEGFQITSSSSLPGLFLAQRPKTCTEAGAAKNWETDLAYVWHADSCRQLQKGSIDRQPECRLG
jgi:hypothetical protein